MAVTVTTLKDRADFLRLRNGRKSVTPYFILRMATSDVAEQSSARVGYTVTTKCGNAVIRNRIKRRLRALVREIFTQSAKPGHDYILIALDRANPSAAVAPIAELRIALQRAIDAVHR